MSDATEFDMTDYIRIWSLPKVAFFQLVSFN